MPGPFGAGEAVLQHALAEHSDVNIVILVARGERAGEVVETIQEFPRITAPHTGGSLMDRTVIICNTSSMPAAAREASIITIGEHYRQMGYQVLLLADATSRWTQAMRETSGRLKELLVRGDGVRQMMQVTGEEGITTEDYVAYQKAIFLDLVFLHPDGPKTKKAPPGYRVGLQPSSD